MTSSQSRRFVVGISGASGAAYALRTIEQLLLCQHQVHLVVSDYGRQLLAQETGVRTLAPESLLPHLAPPPTKRAENKTKSLSVASPTPDQSTDHLPSQNVQFFGAHPAPPPTFSPTRDFPELASRLTIHPHKDVGAVIASGSFMHDGMVIVPCSSTSLGAIASGSGSNLLCRAAAVTLKERRRLIIAHRETPLSLIDIENMRTLTLAGAVICPTNPGLYLKPQRIEDLIDFMAGKLLDLLGVEHALKTRWEDAQ